MREAQARGDFKNHIALSHEEHARVPEASVTAYEAYASPPMYGLRSPRREASRAAAADVVVPATVAEMSPLEA